MGPSWHAGLNPGSVLRKFMGVAGFLILAYLAIGTLLFLCQDSLIFYTDSYESLRLPANVEKSRLKLARTPCLYRVVTS